MSCQLCPQAYASGKRNGERDGRLAVARELLDFCTAITGKGDRLIAAGDVEAAQRMAGAASAVSEFAENLVARVKKEFG
jgi:hypothetical protein